MKAKEYGEWCGDVREDGPAEGTVKVELNWRGFASSSFEGVDAPHAKVANQQKGDHLSARLSTYLVGGQGGSFGGIQNEHRLQCGLY